jgi:hypothetical protein
MATLAQLRAERNRLLKLSRKDNEKARLKREIFNMKYGSKIASVKKGFGTLQGFARSYQKRSSGKGSSYGGSIW